MKIALNCGHTLSGKGTGANGYLNESKVNREVGNRVIEMLRKQGHTVIDCTIDKSDNYLSEAIRRANAQSVDLALSIHFNAGGGTGVEVLTYDKVNNHATNICNEISKLGYRNRGVKQRTELAWLRDTKAKACLVECCFVDSKDDANRYNAQKMAEAIIRGLGVQVPVSDVNSGKQEVLYRVIIGSYRVRDNADKELAKAKEKGFNAFIECVYK